MINRLEELRRRAGDGHHSSVAQRQRTRDRPVADDDRLVRRNRHRIGDRRHARRRPVFRRLPRAAVLADKRLRRQALRRPAEHGDRMPRHIRRQRQRRGRRLRLAQDAVRHPADKPRARRRRRRQRRSIFPFTWIWT